jgi:hypothetical protein
MPVVACAKAVKGSAAKVVTARARPNSLDEFFIFSSLVPSEVKKHSRTPVAGLDRKNPMLSNIWLIEIFQKPETTICLQLGCQAFGCCCELTYT